MFSFSKSKTLAKVQVITLTAANERQRKVIYLSTLISVYASLFRRLK